MKIRAIIPIATALALCAAATAQQSIDQALQNAAADYRERTARATEELNQARARIAAEKVPMLERMRAAQDRVIAARSAATRHETQIEDFAEQRRKLLLDLDSIRKTARYVNTLAGDGLKAAVDGFAPGEDQISGEEARGLQERFDAAHQGSGAAMDAAEFLLSRTMRALGGYRAEGTAILAETSEVRGGTFAFVGPETFFLPESGGTPGAVRPREGSRFPTSHALKTWPAGDAASFFAGNQGSMVADASGGKALKLMQTTGTVWEHVEKGGAVAFAIVGVGLLALLLIIQKVRDLRQMTVDAPARVESILKLVAAGARAEAAKLSVTLQHTTREIFEAGLRHAHEPAGLLEERLQAVLLEQRLHYERRLPLLAVIATAAPLMGLLGTVVGMVKTFALITVFGTGNAAKLSSGISEVLVATELGLVVAIPALVVHGFLAHRIQRNLSRLERYALEFATAVGIAKASKDAGPDGRNASA